MRTGLAVTSPGEAPFSIGHMELGLHTAVLIGVVVMALLARARDPE